MDPSPAAYGRKAADAYQKALGTAASAAAYAVLARSMARELLPEELRAAVRWGASVVSARFGWGARERRTLVVRSQTCDGGYEDNLLFDAARTYLASRIDPSAVRRLGLTLSKARDDGGRSSWRARLFIEPGDSTTDVFDGVEFTWRSVQLRAEERKKVKSGEPGAGGGGRDVLLELSFNAEHMATALDRYVPFVMETAMETKRLERALKICMNEGKMWYHVNHHHPATFDTLAMDPALKQSIIADLDLFTRRREHYRRIGKAWKRGYLLYGPPGTGKSSLLAAMANYLHYNLYDLDLSRARSNSTLQWLLLAMSSRSILVIEDIDCCCDAILSREGDSKDSTKTPPPRARATERDAGNNDGMPHSPDVSPQRTAPSKLSPTDDQVTLSGLLNFIDGLWSSSSDERIIVFTTNYKDRLDPALLRPGRMDMHIYMGYCCWEAFKTLAHNYFLINDHPLFPRIQELLAEVEVTPAEVSEMLLRSEDVDVALGGLKELLKEKKLGK